MLHKRWFDAVEGTCESDHGFIIGRRDQTRGSKITFTAIEQRQKAFGIGDDNPVRVADDYNSPAVHCWDKSLE